jgi:hypothetical protein
LTVQLKMTRLLRGLMVVGLLIPACQKDSRLVPAFQLATEPSIEAERLVLTNI